MPAHSTGKGAQAGDLVLFFPITTKEPEKARFAVEIPAIERRRAGLDADRPLWIISSASPSI
ncbi:MAG: hypothetical protein EOR61_31710, partial [Mesorhizobium sp.]